MKKKTRHGLARTPIYNVWWSMISRCKYPSDTNYKHYGARGIRVCDRWQTFPAFLEDMGMRPDGMTIDRVDTNKDYEPENCRWVSHKANCNNRRSSRFIIFKGETKTLAQWSEITQLAAGTISGRLKKGWSIKDALTKPLMKNQFR